MQVDLLSLSAISSMGQGRGSAVRPAQYSSGYADPCGAQERGKRGGTEDIPGICGAAAAFDEACANMEAERAYLTPLRDRLIAGLTAIPHTALNGDPVRRLPGNVSVCFEGIEGEVAAGCFWMTGASRRSSGSAWYLRVPGSQPCGCWLWDGPMRWPMDPCG